MSEGGTLRQCPYCGQPILLEYCPIVATNFPDAEKLGSSGLDFDTLDYTLPSRSSTRFKLDTGWPLVKVNDVATPVPVSRRRISPLDIASGRARGRNGNGRPALVPLTEIGLHPEDLPARACPECEWPLPPQIDERETIVVAVAGINGAGKTHLLAAALGQAYHDQALRSIGCSEFAPDDTTSTRFQTDYYRVLFRGGRRLRATDPRLEVRFKPLIFNLTTARTGSVSLVVHDVAGELFAERGKRAVAATFLGATRGLIFVADPREIESIRPRLGAEAGDTHDRGYDQGALLAECLRPNGPAEANGRIPVALAVTKADLLPGACNRAFEFLERTAAGESRRADTIARIRQRSAQVKQFLEAYGAQSLLGPAEDYARRCSEARANLDGGAPAGTVTYHAVSAFGHRPNSDGLPSADVEPLNCVDPLAAVLDQIADQFAYAH